MSSHPTSSLELFFDGACPLCRREVDMLRRLDRRQRITFTDISARNFDAMSVTGLPMSTLMARIHARTESGELIEGVEVFRSLYAAVGWRRLVAMSRWPGISALLDVSYRKFAQHRLRLTGRCDASGCSLDHGAQPG